MEKGGVFTNYIHPPGQSDGLGGFFCFFPLFLRKEADMLTRTMEDNLGEGEKEMYVRVRIWHSSIEEGRGMREPPWRKVELMIL